MDKPIEIIKFMKKNNISEVKFDNNYIFRIEYRLENLRYLILNKFRTVIKETYDIECAVEEVEKYRRTNAN